MISIEILRSENNCIRSVNAEGHACWDLKGNDIVCAAVSNDLRTAAQLLERAEGITIDGASKNKGSLFFTVTMIEKEKTEWMRGVSDFLIHSLTKLERDFPHEISVQLSVFKELENGT